MKTTSWITFYQSKKNLIGSIYLPTGSIYRNGIKLQSTLEPFLVASEHQSRVYIHFLDLV